MMRCGELIQTLEMMKTHVQRIAPDAHLSEAVDLMDLYQVRSLPVVDSEGSLIGILSERDILTAIFAEAEALERNSFSSWARAGERLVCDLMTSPVVSVHETEEVHGALLLMFQHELNRIPVLTEQNRVIGILNRVDVLQALFEGTL